MLRLRRFRIELSKKLGKTDCGFFGFLTYIDFKKTVFCRYGTILFTYTLGPDWRTMSCCTGASIAINGACLTVAGIVENAGELLVEFDVMQVCGQSIHFWVQKPMTFKIRVL